MLLVPCPTAQPEHLPSSAVFYCLFNIFPATLHICRPPPSSATWGRATSYWFNMSYYKFVISCRVCYEDVTQSSRNLLWKSQYNRHKAFIALTPAPRGHFAPPFHQFIMWKLRWCKRILQAAAPGGSVIIPELATAGTIKGEAEKLPTSRR